MSHDFAEALFEHARFGLCLWDSDLKCVHVNRVLADMNGLAAEDHIGRSLSEILPEPLPGVESENRKVLETGEAIYNSITTADDPRSPGRLRHLRISRFPLRDDLGAIWGVGSVVEDITETVEARRTLEAESLAVYEDIVQSLTVAALAMEVGGQEQILEGAVHHALEAAKRITSDVASRSLARGDG